MTDKACHEKTVIMDELCVWAEKLRAVSDTIRLAVEQNNLEDLTACKREYDQAREQIFRLVKRLAIHRAEHQC
jgi:hypothetical protein